MRKKPTRFNKYTPTKREQGVVITRRISDPIPTTAEQEQAFIKALSQEQGYRPSVRDERARHYYGISTDQDLLEAIAEANRLRDTYGSSEQAI